MLKPSNGQTVTLIRGSIGKVQEPSQLQSLSSPLTFVLYLLPFYPSPCLCLCLLLHLYLASLLLIHPWPPSHLNFIGNLPYREKGESVGTGSGSSPNPYFKLFHFFTMYHPVPPFSTLLKPSLHVVHPSARLFAPLFSNFFASSPPSCHPAPPHSFDLFLPFAHFDLLHPFSPVSPFSPPFHLPSPSL